MKKRTMMKKAMRMATPMMARRSGPFAAAAGWAGEHLGERFAPARRHRHSTGMSAAYGLGAAMLAIPLGMWVGRRLLGGAGAR